MYINLGASNRETVLRKDDTYTEPLYTFGSNNLPILKQVAYPCNTQLVEGIF